MPTISHVAGGLIVELIYDAGRSATAFAVARPGEPIAIQDEVPLSTGDMLVPYPPHNTLIAHEAVLFANNVQDHGSKEALLADIEAHLNRYLDASPTFIRVSAHYAILSWIYDAFNELPYLRLRGDYGTGKTRGLLAIGQLCYKPFFASGASTISPIFHILDAFGGTLVLDEADLRFSDATSDLVKILNNGTTKGLPVLRTMQNRHRELNPRAFHVFGPKIVATRGRYTDEGLESRFLTEEMGRGDLRGDIPIHLPSAMRAEALALRNRLLHFRLTTLADTIIEPSRVSPHLEPRLNQISLPLLSIIDDSELRANVMEWLADRQQERPSARRRELARATLKVLHNAFDGETSSVPLRVVADRVNGPLGVRASTKEIARMIRGSGIAIRKSGGVHVVAGTELRAIESALGIARANKSDGPEEGALDQVQ